MTRKQYIMRAASILKRRRDALRRTLREDLSQLNTTTERVVGDLGDAALDDDYGLVTSNLAELESQELRHIEHAIERLETGHYGSCEGCGCVIPLARLQALPYATTCVHCQQRQETGGGLRSVAEHWSRVRDDAEMEQDAVALEVAL